MAKQVVVIHGGDTFDTYEEYLKFLNSYTLDFDDLTKRGWKSTLGEKLGGDFEVLAPQMPCKLNAKYLEWKIWFEKIVPFLRDDLILVGHSLGGIFLAKYLSENDFPKKIAAVLLIAAPFDAEDAEYSLADFTLPKSLSKFEAQAGKIFLYQSKDDPVVPFTDIEKYARRLPSATAVILEDRGHFTQEEFPELVEHIKSL